MLEMLLPCKIDVLLKVSWALRVENVERLWEGFSKACILKILGRPWEALRGPGSPGTSK